MRKWKIVLTGILASVLAMGSLGCTMKAPEEPAPTENNVPEFETREMDASTRQTVASLAAADERLTGELENKTIKWLSDWNINPDGTGKTTPTDLAVFQERYGGNVEWYQCI